MTRLACLSVDLDEIHHYQSIHGLSGEGVPAAAHAVYDVALARFATFATEQGLPLTLFAVGSDLGRSDNAVALRQLAQAGHEVANHSLDHRYDLTRLSQSEMRRQIIGGAEAIERVVGQVPTGFRAPGYLMNDALADVLSDCNVAYDSSVFPCPHYYGAKALVLAGQRCRGRHSASLVGPPTVLAAPTTPYRLGRPYWRRGSGLLELPIQVTPRFRLPFIGTALTLAGPRVASWLTRQVAGLEFVNLELHGIDLLSADDAGLGALGRYQTDLRVPLTTKTRILGGVIERLRRAGFEFVRLDQAAQRLAIHP